MILKGNPLRYTTDRFHVCLGDLYKLVACFVVSGH